jgi:hypothetical protein
MLRHPALELRREHRGCPSQFVSPAAQHGALTRCPAVLLDSVWVGARRGIAAAGT